MIPAKICGITRADDALLAIELGASAIGFIFYPGSPRYINTDEAARISEHLPAHRARIGVFVNPDLKTLLLTVATARLTHVQLAGEETPWLCRQSSAPVIKSVRPAKGMALEAFQHFPAAALLVDSHRNGQYGGTGTTSDWQFCRDLRSHGLTILAGGISLKNVEGAIAKAMPDAIDLCSSVEKSPGIKDHEKLTALFATLRSIDDSHSRLSRGFLVLS